MPKASRSFCQLDLAPLLQTASDVWTQALLEHASSCPCCALRLSAIERLNTRLSKPLETILPPTAANSRRARVGRLARLMAGPARRATALAMAGLAVAVLALAVGRGLGPGLALLSSSVVPSGFPSSTFSRGARGSSSEDQARELARNGSPAPLRLMPPTVPRE